MTGHSNDLQSDIDRILDHLRSDDHGTRHTGYTLLQQRAIYLHGQISPDHVLALMGAILNEPDRGLREMGLVGLKKFQDGASFSGEGKTHDPGGSHPPSDSSVEESLGQYLWAPFAQDSAVFAVCDVELMRRDEAAEVYLGRRLSFDDFPRTNFQHFLTSEERAHLALQGQPYKAYKAICVVGRPGLLGEAFLSQIDYRKTSGDPRNPTVERTRFNFETHKRPPGLPRNALDPNYHFITETFGDGTCERHSTQEEGNLRVDYGLLQRYAVELAGGTLIVVVCAGASSLGTLGAAQWASLTLCPSMRTSGEGTPIPAPRNPPSRIEALVRVTADSTLGVWEAPRVEPVKLFADDRMWSISEKKWLIAPPDEVTVVYRGSRPVEVHFDRKLHRAKPGKNMFNLIVSLVEMTLRGSQWIELSELRSMAHIGEEKRPKKEAVTGEYVHSQLIPLRQRHLGEALWIDGDRVSLRCKVRRVDET